MSGKSKGRLKSRDAEKSDSVKLSSSASVKLSDDLYPEFSLRYLRKGHCVESCIKDEKAALAEKLFRLSKLTWAEIKQLPRHGLGYEKIGRSSFKVGIPDHITADVDLIAFRFNGLAPMIGYRRNSTFYIVWLDRAFNVYDH